jgi:hypothetical protein
VTPNTQTCHPDRSAHTQAYPFLNLPGLSFRPKRADAFAFQLRSCQVVGSRSGATVRSVKLGALPLRFLQGWASPEVHDQHSLSALRIVSPPTHNLYSDRSEPTLLLFNFAPAKLSARAVERLSDLSSWVPYPCGFCKGGPRPKSTIKTVCPPFELFLHRPTTCIPTEVEDLSSAYAPQPITLPTRQRGV